MKLTFEPIRLERQADYLSLLGRMPQVASDYSFINLWGWAAEYDLTWAWTDNLVWIKQGRPETVFWAPVGDWHSVDWEGCLAPLKETPETVLTRVPERLALEWRDLLGDKVTIDSRRRHWDYLYDVEELVQLKGNRFHKKKNLLNQFIKKYDYTYKPLAADLVEPAMGMQADWCNWRDCESSAVLSAENQAVLTVFKDWDALEGLMGGALLVDEMIVAYTVAEALTPDTLLIHYEKGCTAHKGVYQAINQMFLAHSGKGYHRVNREQDLGEEGLRKAKLSYQPVDFIKKYRVFFSR